MGCTVLIHLRGCDITNSWKMCIYVIMPWLRRNTEQGQRDMSYKLPLAYSQHTDCANYQSLRHTVVPLPLLDPISRYIHVHSIHCQRGTRRAHSQLQLHMWHDNQLMKVPKVIISVGTKVRRFGNL